MKLKAVRGIMLMALLIVVLGLAFNIQSVNAGPDEVAVIDVRRINPTQFVTDAYKGCPAEIEVDVQNVGTTGITYTLQVQVYDTPGLINVNTGFTQGNITNPWLAGSIQTLTLHWCADPAGVIIGQSYTIRAEIAPATGETNTGDNKLDSTSASTPFQIHVRTWGDVNGDGIVGLADIGKLDLQYSQVLPVPLGNLMPDITGNGKFTLSDVGKLDLIYSGIIPPPWLCP